MKLALYWVDAFASKPFRGNPAGVVPLDQWLPDEVMQGIAFENGLAETAFFVRTAPGRFHLRWFTPAVEVDLCGHATLASAFTLFTLLGLSGNLVTFDSRSGPLTVSRQGDLLELDFPSTPPVPETTAARDVIAAIGQTPLWLGRTKFDLLAVLPDAAAVQSLQPDMAKVAALGGRSLVVTARGIDCDFVSRFFAPQSGIAEDPATGSTHCALIPYWAGSLGKTKLFARQLSARGGEFFCVSRGDRVGIAGHTVLYLRGEIAV
ncbi:MAG TPA: PhzF family phenazine biosynthesis protein [Lacunisphaera sp.]|nr:PhzF family phenazine biosynthesis protein [Lacunisphaera sp.]